MNRPFCTINKKKYQLREVNGVIRFNDDKRISRNANEDIISYQEGRLNLATLLDYYTNTGCSYELVWCRFSSASNQNVLLKSDGKIHFRLYR